MRNSCGAIADRLVVVLRIARGGQLRVCVHESALGSVRSGACVTGEKASSNRLRLVNAWAIFGVSDYYTEANHAALCNEHAQLRRGSSLFLAHAPCPKR